MKNVIVHGFRRSYGGRELTGLSRCDSLQRADWCGVTDEIHFGGGGGRRVEDVPSDVPSENQQEESENDYSFPQRSFLFL